ncbi:MAG: alpha/beta hydrolase, partial [Verrucomicrobia bacterium]
LEAGGNRDVTIRALPGLNHLFQQCTTGLPSEYGMIEETMNPAVLELVGEWILERVGAQGS